LPPRQNWQAGAALTRTLATVVVLGDALCMVAMGAVHATLARYPAVPDVGASTAAARWLCTLSLVAIFLTGYVGYFVVDAIWVLLRAGPS
jgi:hypothetical protein